MVILVMMVSRKHRRQDRGDVIEINLMLTCCVIRATRNQFWLVQGLMVLLFPSRATFNYA
jgi:hypothetical protein